METKSPPQVAAEATHISFPIWQVMQPCDGMFMHYLTLAPCPPGTDEFRQLNCYLDNILKPGKLEE